MNTYFGVTGVVNTVSDWSLGLYGSYSAASNAYTAVNRLPRAAYSSVETSTMVETWSGSDILPAGLSRMGFKSRVFKPGEDLKHYEKHSQRIIDRFDLSTYSVEEYVSDANSVIRTGIYVPELSAYVNIPVGVGKKSASQFVGVDRITGEITTYHVKYARDLADLAPSLGWTFKSNSELIDLIGTDMHTGYKYPYRNRGPGF